MFGFLKPSTHADIHLGSFVRTKGMWRGVIGLPDLQTVPLLLSGSKSGPDAEALASAKLLPGDVGTWRSVLEEAFFEHYGPYAEAAAAENDVQHISEPREVWTHTQLQYVAIQPLSGKLTTELGYSVAWDPEHTLGAHFQRGVFIELNGSVVQP